VEEVSVLFLIEKDGAPPLAGSDAGLRVWREHRGEETIYRIAGPGPLPAAQEILIPLPGGVGPDAATLLYYVSSGPHAGWHHADSVAGWLEPGSKQWIERDGGVFMRIRVLHGGYVRIARAEGAYSGAGLGANLADAAMALAAASALLLIQRNRRGRKRGRARGSGQF
jgi:hypothetical protein